MFLHQLPKSKTYKRRKRVGRGDSSGHGNQSTRGGKGQTARSGGAGGLKLKGLKRLVSRFPKQGGFQSIYPKKETVSIGDLNQKFKDGDIITPVKLFQADLIATVKNGVKILGDGALTKKLEIRSCLVSKSAIKAIEKAGGKINLKVKKHNARSR